MIIGLSGYIGVGKDAVARCLFQLGRRRTPYLDVQRIGFADPLKRICQEVYDFNPDHLWGGSELRDIPDQRYFNAALPGSYLTPRHAIKELGTTWGRGCFDLTWVEYGIRQARVLLADPKLQYTGSGGLRLVQSTETELPETPRVVCFTDTRFLNEFNAIRQAGGRLVRIKNPRFPVPSTPHPSESEQATLSDANFDYVLQNDVDLEDLDASKRRLTERVAQMMDALGL